MKSYRIRYTDHDDPGCPVFSCIVKAYGREHAIEVWHEAGIDFDDGWRVVSCARVRRERSAA